MTRSNEARRTAGRRPAIEPGGQALMMSVPAVSTSAARVRTALGKALDGRVAERVLTDAQLLASELVTNSIRHAGLASDQSVRVGAEIFDGRLRLEVVNPGTEGTVAPREPNLQRGGGFGLRVVEALAEAWGVSRVGQTCVWVEMVRWPDGAPTAQLGVTQRGA